MKYLLSILAIIVGVLLVIKTEWLVKNFGYIEEAEGSLRAWGGTRLVIKLVGLIMIIIAFLVMTGTMQSFLLSIFGSMMGGIAR